MVKSPSELENELGSLGIQDQFKRNLESQTLETDSSNESLERTRFLTEDKSIPAYLKDRLWAFADKEIVLTNFSDRDMLRVRNKQKIIELMSICDMPPGSLTFSKELDMEQMDLKVFIKASRSHHGFERILQNTEIKQMKIKAESDQKGKRKLLGGLGRLFGRKQSAESGV